MEHTALSFSEMMAVVRRRFVVFANTFVALLSLAVLLAFGLPSIYESTATILIEQQNIPDDLVQSTITSYADERIQVISQRVMSTDNLATLVQAHRLYGYGQDDESIVTKVTKLRESISVEPISADVFNKNSGRPGRATIAFTVAVQNQDPKVAHELAMEVTDLFLEENRRSRAEQSLETVAFLQSQAAAYQSEIDRIEGEISKFKSEYQGMLPENVNLSLQALEREERRSTEIRSEIRSQEERIRYLQDERRMLMAQAGGAVDRMAELQEEFARVSAKYAPNHPDVLRLRREIEILRQSGGETADGESAAAIAQVQRELAAAKERYSANHPDVVRLQRTLAALEEQSESGEAGSITVASPAVRQIDSELRERRAILSGLRQTQAELISSISALEDDLQGVPEVERQYRMLTRRYEEAVDRHDQIQTKLAAARMSSELETEQLGERFTPIDPPRLPTSPASPNRLGILALGVVLAGAISIAALALADVSDSSVRNARDIQELLGVPPLASIPLVETRVDRRKRFVRILGHASFAGLMISIAVIGVVYLSA
jgi:uncharacterized protein involved in exopolysaccharide biosynthesis